MLATRNIHHIDKLPLLAKRKKSRVFPQKSSLLLRILLRKLDMYGLQGQNDKFHTSYLFLASLPTDRRASATQKRHFCRAISARDNCQQQKLWKIIHWYTLLKAIRRCSLQLRQTEATFWIVHFSNREWNLQFHLFSKSPSPHTYFSINGFARKKHKKSVNTLPISKTEMKTVTKCFFP